MRTALRIVGSSYDPTSIDSGTHRPADQLREAMIAQHRMESASSAPSGYGSALTSRRGLGYIGELDATGVERDPTKPGYVNPLKAFGLAPVTAGIADKKAADAAAKDNTMLYVALAGVGVVGVIGVVLLMRSGRKTRRNPRRNPRRRGRR